LKPASVCRAVVHHDHGADDPQRVAEALLDREPGSALAIRQIVFVEIRDRLA
jgi:hypothetical protein